MNLEVFENLANVFKILDFVFSHDILFNKELNKKGMRKSLKRCQPRHTR